MYKDNAKICIDKIFESSTTEENGLEVDVNTESKSNYDYSFHKAILEGISQLTFYDNVYIDDTIGILGVRDDLKNFNTRKIADFKTFKLCDSVEIRNSLLMGNVLYPINSDIIKTWFKGMASVPFAIKCNIGDVDVTPNREQLLYNQKTTDTINKCCQAALEEFKEICKTKFSSDFNSIDDYYKFINAYNIYIEVKSFSENNEIIMTIPISELAYYDLSGKVTVCGKVPSKQLAEHYRNFLYTILPYNTILYRYKDDRFYVKDITLNIDGFISYYKEHKLYLLKEPLKPIAKKYFPKFTGKPTYKCYYFLYKKRIYSAFRQIVRDYCKTYNTKPTDPNLKFIYQDFIKNYSNIETYGLEDVPQSFIDAEKIKNQYNKSNAIQQKARKCVIYKLTQGRKYQSISYDSSETSEELKRYKGTVFFAEKGNPYLEMFYQTLITLIDIGNKNIILVEVASSNLPILREMNNTIEFSSVFTKKNNIISKICTYVYLAEKWFNSEKSTTCWYENDLLPSKFYRILNQIKYYYRNLSYNSVGDNELLKILCKTYLENGWLNYTIINTVEANTNILKLDSIFARKSITTLENIIVAFHEYITKNNINQNRLKLIKETLKPILDEYTPNQKLPHFDIG